MHMLNISKNDIKCRLSISKMVGTGWTKWNQLKRELIGMYRVVNDAMGVTVVAS